MRKNSMIAAAGKMALLWAAWGSGLVGILYVLIWLLAAGYDLLGVLAFSIWTAASTVAVLIKFHHMFTKTKGVPKGNLDEWVLLVTVVAATFAVGGSFQSISSIGAETLSNSTCAKPTGLNVTSLNCVQVQTVAHTRGPFLYFGQLGIWIVALASLGLFAFGLIYFILRELPTES